MLEVAKNFMVSSNRNRRTKIEACDEESRVLIGLGIVSDTMSEKIWHERQQLGKVNGDSQKRPAENRLKV